MGNYSWESSRAWLSPETDTAVWSSSSQIPLPSCFPFTGLRPVVWSEGVPCLLLLPLPLPFSRITPNKSPSCLIPLWCLLWKPELLHYQALPGIFLFHNFLSPFRHQEIPLVIGKNGNKCAWLIWFHHNCKKYSKAIICHYWVWISIFIRKGLFQHLIYTHCLGIFMATLEIWNKSGKLKQVQIF